MADGVLAGRSHTRIGTTAIPRPEAQQPKSIRYDYIDGLRALTALYVVLHHEWREIWLYENGHFPPDVLRYLGGWLNYGRFGVSAFIVISGFCLMLPVVRHHGRLPVSVRQWLLRRGWRILPPYYAVLGVSLLLDVTLISKPTGADWDGCLPVNGLNIISHLLLYQDVYGPTRINHALWSIATEWHIYFLFPLLLLLWNQVGPRNTTVLAAVVSYGVYLLLHTVGIEPAWFGVVPQYVALFVFGMFAATIVASQESRWARLREGMRWDIVAAIAFTVVCAYEVLSHGYEWVYGDYPMGIGVASLLIACAQVTRGRRLRRLLATKPLRVIGSFSYSLYLIHAPLIQIIWQYAIHPLHYSDPITFALLVLIGTPLIVGTAYLFFRVFERPFLYSRRPVASVMAS